MAYFNGSKDFLLALQGESSKWYSGTGITGDGTENNAVNSTNSGITLAKKFDMYLNTETYNVYACISGGTWEQAKWMYLCNIKGDKGDNGVNGESSKWYCGTGTLTSTGVLVGETINANVGDMYLNTDTGDVYRCDYGGSWVDARWSLVVNIKGDSVELATQFDDSADGKAADAGAVRDALRDKVGAEDFNTLKNAVNNMIYPVEDPDVMDGILSEDPEKVLDKIYMYVGPTTAKYKTGGVYKLTEEIMD